MSKPTISAAIEFILALTATHIGSLFDGLIVTIWVTAGASALTITLAMLAGIARRSERRAVRRAAATYVELFRGVPVIVQLFWLYYVLPMFGVTLPASAVAIIALGLCFGAYGAEIVRSARDSVAHGQVDAACALGMKRAPTFWLVIFPQALPVALPQLGNLLVDLLKSSALVSLVTLHDLTFNAQNIILETQAAGSIFLVILIFYYALASIILFGIRIFERSLNRTKGRA